MSSVRSVKGWASVSEINVLTFAQKDETLSTAEIEGDKIEMLQAKSVRTPVKSVTGNENEQPSETPSAEVSASDKTKIKVNRARLQSAGMPGSKR